MSDNRAGNSFIFCLFTLLNMLLVVLGLGIAAAAVYLWTLTKTYNYFTLSFLGLGVFISMIATWAFCMRKSTIRLSLYILILLILSVVQTASTILLIVKRDQVVDWWMDHIDAESQEAFQKAKQEMEDNINITQYSSNLICIATVCHPFSKFAYNTSANICCFLQVQCFFENNRTPWGAHTSE